MLAPMVNCYLGEFRTFETLECWQAGRALRVFLAKEVLPVLPKDEGYRLGDQVLRAARSVTANIALRPVG